MDFKSLFLWVSSLQLTWWQALIYLIIIMVGFNTYAIIKQKKNILSAIFKRKKKSSIRCIDCIQILHSKTEALEIAKIESIHERDKLENTILRSEMNFAEGKIAEIEDKFITFYNDLISNSSRDNNTGKEVTEYRMFWGLVKSSTRAIQDKFRYSFKENGFHKLSGSAFANFVKSKSNGVLDTFKQEIINLYPTTENTIVSSSEILDFIKRVAPEVEDIVFDIYINAKRVVIDTKLEIKSLKDLYNVKNQLFKDELELFITNLQDRR